MIQITPQMKIYLAVQPINFKNGFDGLAAVCRRKLEQDPFSGALFLFRNRRGISVKILVYDGQGFWCCQKRFSSGNLKWWPSCAEESMKLNASQLQILLWNGNPLNACIPADWRKVA